MYTIKSWILILVFTMGCKPDTQNPPNKIDSNVTSKSGYLIIDGKTYSNDKPIYIDSNNKVHIVDDTIKVKDTTRFLPAEMYGKNGIDIY